MQNQMKPNQTKPNEMKSNQIDKSTSGLETRAVVNTKIG